MSELRVGLDDFHTIAEPPQNGTGDKDSWQPILLTSLPEHPPVQPTLGGLGFVYPATRHVFSGPQESAKTLAAYAVAIQVVRNDGGPVILIDFEMGSYNARNRLRELGATEHDLAQIPYLEPHEPATETRIGTLAALNPQLVIIDAAAGAYDLQGLDDNKRQDVGKISRLYVDRFWKHGIATIFLDHVVKNTETRGKYAIGSERKVGGTEVHLGFEVITPISRGSRGLYKITTHKDRGGYLKRGVLAEMSLESDPDTHRITWEFKPASSTDDEHPWMPTKQMQKVSALLAIQTEPVSRNQIVAEIGGRKDYTLKALDHLCRLGYATETDGPRNAKMVSHARSFTVHEWENQPDPPPVPTGSPVVPGTSPTSGSRSSPPYGGNGTTDAAPEPAVVPDYDWVDELTPPEPPPDDLWDDTTPNDDIPL